ncbi:MAG TPA: serine/threonine-protein kinase [Nannocystaceae bacterium]|nr:serine/threonine-protein kinase [Nannocystaceae bacterium]
MNSEFELEQLIGQLIADRYRVDALLGAGGMGAVLRCRHVGLDTDVALKVLHPHLCGHDETMRRFEQEAKSASRLDHPNCVRVLDFGSWRAANLPPSKYLCMELLWGVELARLLEQPLGHSFAIDVAGQMLDGLAHAHGRGVVHRDVKPHNVVVVAGNGRANVVKLVDFGIAMILSGDRAAARMTREGRICGTPNFMSPEQVVGGPIDGRADLYALGVLLYRMLAGRLPFVSDDVRAILQMHVTETPPPLPSTISPALQRFVARLLEKDPERRPQSAAAARAELDAIVTDTQRRATRLYAGGIAEVAPIPIAAALGSDPPRPEGRRRIAVVHEGFTSAATASEPALVSGRSAPKAGRRKWIARAAAVTPAFAAIALVLAGTSDDAPHEEEIASAEIVAPAEITVADRPAEPSSESDTLQRARALAELPHARARALAAYDRLLVREPALIEDARVFAEIAALTRDPRLRAPAVDLVLEHFGARGGPLLVELLNTRLEPLGYRDRQRALAVVAQDPSLAALLDRPHLDVLDLRDAGESDAPCSVFASALARIDAAEQPPASSELDDITPPIDTGDARLCERLPAQLDATRRKLAERARPR